MMVQLLIELHGVTNAISCQNGIICLDNAALRKCMHAVDHYCHWIQSLCTLACAICQHA